jgi:hypothetical protein
MSAPQPTPIDRRRYPRTPAVRDEVVCWPVTVDVELLEISVGGVLLSTVRPLTIGHRAHLRVVLNGEPFAALVEVCRLVPAHVAASGRWVAAAFFVNLADAHRRSLQMFLASGNV